VLVEIQYTLYTPFRLVAGGAEASDTRLDAMVDDRSVDLLQDRTHFCRHPASRVLQEVDEARQLVERFGAKFDVFATEVNGSSYERLTLHGIRGNTRPGDRILCAPLLIWNSNSSTDPRSGPVA
jgi:hypothetical protein